MKLTLSKTEAFDLLKFLKESKFKYMNLSALASARSKSNKFSKNAEKLRESHKSKSELATNLINRIVEQL